MPVASGPVCPKVLERPGGTFVPPGIFPIKVKYKKTLRSFLDDPLEPDPVPLPDADGVETGGSVRWYRQ